MAAKYELFYGTLSDVCRAVLLIVKLTNAPHKVHIVSLAKGEHTKPEFLKLNPFHRVPVVVHGDFTLTESPAIARYILNTHKSADHWYPADPKKRARVDEYISYQHTNLRAATVNIAMDFVFTPERTGQPTPEEKKEELMKNFHEVLQGFQGYFLKDSSFIAGEKVSIADIFAVSVILQADLSGRDYLSAHPKIKAWIERTKATTQPHFDEVLKDFTAFVKATYSGKSCLPVHIS